MSLKDEIVQVALEVSGVWYAETVEYAEMEGAYGMLCVWGEYRSPVGAGVMHEVIQAVERVIPLGVGLSLATPLRLT